MPTDVAQIESQTESRIRQIDNLLDDLNGDLEVTQGKLKSVIVVSPTSLDKAGEDTDDDSSTDLNKRLQELISRLRSYRRRVRELNERIDL